ncbi:hypothetical protein K502DRAFT_351927 [Neoconidiobolus thromboides FSU 785]|nr:hypothetical protein K502DRAFT_351927 [Neoconidiobolus thromboides FSU 785]
MNYTDNRESRIGLNSGRERMSIDENGIPQKKRNCCVRFCCCCCLSRKGALLCGVITLILLGGIGAAIFFLFPRIPSFEFKQLSYQDGSSITSSSLTDKISHSSDGVVSIPLALNLDIKSQNYINIAVSNITIDAKLNNSPIGQGYLPRPVSINAMATTPFTLPFTLFYNTKDTSKENLATASILKSSCNSDASKRKPLTINYDAKLYIDLIKWTGYVPQINNNFNFDCPWDVSVLFDQSNILNLLSSLL